jgi:hypothetical protein
MNRLSMRCAKPNTRVGSAWKSLITLPRPNKSPKNRAKTFDDFSVVENDEVGAHHTIPLKKGTALDDQGCFLVRVL